MVNGITSYRIGFFSFKSPFGDKIISVNKFYLFLFYHKRIRCFYLWSLVYYKLIITYILIKINMLVYTSSYIVSLGKFKFNYEDIY